MQQRRQLLRRRWRGATTLKLVIADYGTGRSDADQYWAGIVTAFEKAHSDIKVNVPSIP